MSLGLFLILSMGGGVLYSILGNHKPANIQDWMIVVFSVCTIWMLFIMKDWRVYHKLYKNNNKLINDERFQGHSNLAAKISFISLISSNLLLLIIDLSLFSLSAPFISVFSLVLGASVYLLSHIILELRA